MSEKSVHGHEGASADSVDTVGVDHAKQPHHPRTSFEEELAEIYTVAFSLLLSFALNDAGDQNAMISLSLSLSRISQSYPDHAFNRCSDRHVRPYPRVE